VSRRTLAAAVILGAWIVSLGWLVKREVFPPTGARLAEAALRVPPGAAYYRLAVAERQVGFASSTIDTSSTSIRVTEVLVLQVPAVGTLHRTTAMSRATFSRTLRFEGVEARFDGDLGRFAVRGLATGDTVLAVSLVSATDSETTRMPLVRPIVLPTILPLRLAFGGELRPGKVYTSAVFDPMLLAQRPVEVTVAAESTLVVPDSAGFDSTTMAWVAAHFDTVRAFRIEERSGGSPTTAWIDAQGHIVRAENAAGFTMERMAFELAYVNFRHRDTARVARASANPGPGEVVATTALVARAPALSRRDTLSLLRIRLSGAAPGGPDFTTGRQRLVGDTLAVRRQGGSDLTPGYRLPARERRLARLLAPEPWIESDDPRIKTQARLIVGREDDPARAARLIHDWVAQHVEPRPTAGAVGAVHVLETRSGDCNETTVLYVALARAAGLPARPVAGLLYRGGRFYYHAWPEVYLGDWVAVDPALDQFPADAAHVRFVVGGLARQAELVRLIGSLKLEVL
jgi:hypothetical protein